MNEDSFSPLGRMNKEQRELLSRNVEKGNLIKGTINFCSNRLNISTMEVSKIINGIRNEIPGRNPKETEMVVSRVTNLYKSKQSIIKKGGFMSLCIVKKLTVESG